jgi:hypothetical protein
MTSKQKLVLFGAVALVVLTGCVGGNGGDGGDAGEIDGGGTVNDAGEATVAVAVGLGEDAPPGVAGRLNLSRSDRMLFRQARQSPDELSEEQQERVQQIQQEVQQAQQELQEEEEQAVQEKREQFGSTVNSTRTLSMEGSQRVPQQTSTLFLVSGNPSEVLGLLNESGVQAITREEQFNRMQQRQQQRGMPAPGGAPAP